MTDRMGNTRVFARMAKLFAGMTDRMGNTRVFARMAKLFAGMRRGLTLIEIMFALGILAMAVVAFFPTFNQGIAFTKEIRDYSILVNLAEFLTNDYYVQISHSSKTSSISIFEEDITASVKSRCQNPIFDTFRKFKVLATVRPSFLCENGGYEVIIRFDWEAGGRSKTFSLASVKAAPDQP